MDFSEILKYSCARLFTKGVKEVTINGQKFMGACDLNTNFLFFHQLQI